MKIVIIEDEKLTAQDLAKTIGIIEADAEVIAFLYSVEEAIIYFKQKPEVDLIFSDIELGDGLSFDIFKKIENDIPIVFCTAYEKYTLEAFNTLSIDYILKPFSKTSIEKTLLKFKNLSDKFSKKKVNYNLLFDTLKSHVNQSIPSVIINQGDKIIPINGKDIALFYLDNNSTYGLTFDHKKFIVTQNLDTLEKQYLGTFYRANRQYLINRKAVKDASYYFNRKLLVNLTISYQELIVVSKLKAGDFINWLKSN